MRAENELKANTCSLQALLTLNSCPMFTYNERDLHRMPTPARSHLPMKDYIAASGILDDEANAMHNNDADVALLRLPAPSLRGTFAKAYALLAQLVSLIGWDELLKCRSLVFVMEEEYRMQKTVDVAPDSPGRPKMNGMNGSGDESEKEGFGPLALEEDDADDDASSKGVHAPTPVGASAPRENLPTPSSPSIPTIKVSTESDGEREREAIAAYEEDVTANGSTSRMAGEAHGVEKPAHAHAEDDAVPAPTTEAPGTSASGAQAPGTFSNKRLCERWLDNLFMVLYEVSDCETTRVMIRSLKNLLVVSRIFACIRSGGPKWHISKLNTCPTARLAQSGKS